MRAMLKSKIHRARVTEANVNYEGSVTIDKKLMEAADILPYEQVDVLNVNSGARLTTYAIEGEKGEICLNGAAARQFIKGDIAIILSYTHIDVDLPHKWHPKLVYVDENNAITRIKHEIQANTVVV